MDQLPTLGQGTPSAPHAGLYVVWSILIVVGGIVIATGITQYGHAVRAAKEREIAQQKMVEQVQTDHMLAQQNAHPDTAGSATAGQQSSASFQQPISLKVGETYQKSGHVCGGPLLIINTMLASVQSGTAVFAVDINGHVSTTTISVGGYAPTTLYVMRVVSIEGGTVSFYADPMVAEC
ncbi:MAG TPA: hypothetical protein VGP13_01785 [Candidatus Paceibacterota bacterium]|jgi:type II secretory pathway pseudopilin PulG|nr:hypothetical protein [Candidatus Paceibacterota bacterium]